MSERPSDPQRADKVDRSRTTIEGWARAVANGSSLSQYETQQMARDYIKALDELDAERLSARSAGGLIPQGPCETTQTPRFQIADCACGTYEGNLGPCLTWWQGNSGRCVYCEHGLDCHVKLSKLLAPSVKHQDDPKNANLAALVLKLDKHISLHEMFSPEWEAIVAVARATHSASGWIVVEDRLPKTDEQVLIYERQTEHEEIAIAFVAGDGSWRLHESPGTQMYPSHWRPLPSFPTIGAIHG